MKNLSLAQRMQSLTFNWYIYDNESAAIGEHRFWHNGEHMKVSEEKWIYVPNRFSVIHDWLDFSAQTKECVIVVDGISQKVDIPKILLIDSYSQSMNKEDYQMLSKDLKQKEEYLKKFDISQASEEKISDAVRLMGFVNAMAFKGYRKHSKDEALRNFEIYKKVKEPFLNSLVEFCISEDNKLLSYDDVNEVLYIDNPYTNVQISFHCKPNYSQALNQVDENYWNKSKRSFVYESPQEMAFYENCLSHLRNETYDLMYVLDKFAGGGGFMKSIEKSENNNSIFYYEWANGECDGLECNSEEEALEFWKKHINDHMQLIRMWNPVTGKNLLPPGKIKREFICYGFPKDVYELYEKNNSITD